VYVDTHTGRIRMTFRAATRAGPGPWGVRVLDRGRRAGRSGFTLPAGSAA